MKTYIEYIDNGVQIRINENDENMTIYDSLVKILDENHNVKNVKKCSTFETPIAIYKYKEIEFSVLFDEMCDETFVFVDKKYDYNTINSLLLNV